MSLPSFSPVSSFGSSTSSYSLPGVGTAATAAQLTALSTPAAAGRLSVHTVAAHRLVGSHVTRILHITPVAAEHCRPCTVLVGRWWRWLVSQPGQCCWWVTSVHIAASVECWTVSSADSVAFQLVAGCSPAGSAAAAVGRPAGDPSRLSQYVSVPSRTAPFPYNVSSPPACYVASLLTRYIRRRLVVHQHTVQHSSRLAVLTAAGLLHNNRPLLCTCVGGYAVIGG